MARKATKRKVKPIDAMPPTPEQASRADYVPERETAAGQVGKVRWRKVRQLETLVKAGIIRKEDAPAVHRYRYFADMVERSSVKDSLNKAVGGSSGPVDVPKAVMHAKNMTSRCEAACGEIRDILHAVIVSDTSLREWAMERHGAIDDCRMIDGHMICGVRPRQLALDMARLEIMTACGFVRGVIERS